MSSASTLSEEVKLLLIVDKSYNELLVVLVYRIKSAIKFLRLKCPVFLNASD